MIGKHLTQLRVVLLRGNHNRVAAIRQQPDGAIEVAHVRHPVEDEQDLH